MLKGKNDKYELTVQIAGDETNTQNKEISIFSRILSTNIIRAFQRTNRFTSLNLSICR